MDYQIQSGDNLTKIAKAHGATTSAEINKFINDVAKLNNIKNVNLIFAGHTLKLPGDVFGNGEAQAPDEAVAKEEELAIKFNEWIDSNNAKLDSVMDSNSADEIQQVLDETGASTFNFINSDAELTTETGAPSEIYIQESAKFAKAIQDSWEKDGEEGISFKEYREEEISKMDGLEIDKTTEDLIQKAFDMMDLNSNGVIEQNEIQGVYSALDYGDNVLDGQINFENYGNAIQMSENVKQSAQIFNEKYLKEE